MSIQPLPFYASLILLQLLTLTYQDFHHILFLPCIHQCMVALAITSLGHSLERFYCLLLIKLSFKVSFNQACLESAGNLVTSTKF